MDWTLDSRAEAPSSLHWVESSQLGLLEALSEQRKMALQVHQSAPGAPGGLCSLQLSIRFIHNLSVCVSSLLMFHEAPVV